MNLTAGVIGCGSISRFHFAGLEEAGVRVKWVCDLREQAAAPYAARFKATYTADYRRILDDPEVNVVEVLTFSRSHKELCLAAIAAGKAVICEKTLAENADDALEIVSEAGRRGTVFYTSYMKRFIPAVEKAREILPLLGRIMSTHVRAHQMWGNLWGDPPTSGWLVVPPGGISGPKKNYGGGILVCGGSHVLDLVLFLLGRPTRLFAHVHRQPGFDVEATAAVLMETASGPVLFEALAHPLTRIGFLRDGWDERVEISGVNGRLEIYSAEWNQVEHKASPLIHYDNATGQATEYRFPPASPFARAVEFFCTHIAKGEQGPQSRLTGYEVDELIAHIYHSGATGRALDVAWRA